MVNTVGKAMMQESINALGFVEVRGLAAAIETADSMLKTADVRLLRQLLRDPAQITLTVEGELGACRAAVDAGREHAMRMNAFVCSQVLGRPDGDTADFVLRLAEQGRRSFGERPSPKVRARPVAVADTPEMSAAPPSEAEDARLLAALAGLPSGCALTDLVRRVGGQVGQVLERLEAMRAAGQVEKVRGRYRLPVARGDGKNERDQ